MSRYAWLGAGWAAGCGAEWVLSFVADRISVVNQIRDKLSHISSMFRTFDVSSEDVIPDFKISIAEFSKVQRQPSELQ